MDECKPLACVEETGNERLYSGYTGPCCEGFVLVVSRARGKGILQRRAHRRLARGESRVRPPC